MDRRGAAFGKLTADERDALEMRFNLADGHARNTLTAFWAGFSKIDPTGLAQLSNRDLESRLISALAHAYGQPTLARLGRTKLLSSASLSLELVANLLRIQRRSILAPEPCFDNLVDIMSRHCVPLHAYGTELSDFAGNVLAHLSETSIDTLLLVLPNNPTGWSMTRAEFSQIATSCQRRNVLLLVDMSFRAFDPQLLTWDMYEVLESSKTRYVVVEDTGKLLATAELKASLITSDQQSHKAIENIYDDFTIGLSPAVLVLLTDLVNELSGRGIDQLRCLAARNFRTLVRSLGAWFTPISSAGPVCWLDTSQLGTGASVVQTLADAGVATLAGSRFHWQNHSSGEYRLRVALMRDPDYFDSAMNVAAPAIERWVRPK